MLNKISSYLFVFVFLFITFVNGQGVALVRPLLPYGGVEAYASSLQGLCSVMLSVIGPYNGAAAIDSCTLSASPTITTGSCDIFQMATNGTHFSSLIDTTFNGPNDYTDMVLVLTLDNSTDISFSLKTLGGLSYGYSCELLPANIVKSINSFTDFRLLESSNGINTMQFISYLTLNNEIKRYTNAFTCNSSPSISCQFTFISLKTLMVTLTFNPGFAATFPDTITISIFGNDGVTIPSPVKQLDYFSIELTVKDSFEFPNQPGSGFFVEISSNSLSNKTAPINLDLVPLAGSINDMAFYYKHPNTGTVQPRYIAQNVLTAFWDPLPNNDNVEQPSIITTYVDGFLSVKLETNNRFSIRQGSSLTSTFYNNYPFGLVGVGGLGVTNKIYKFPLATDANQALFDLFIGAPVELSSKIFMSPALVDTKPPRIDSLEVIIVNSTHSILRIRASDDISGVNLIQFNTFARTLDLNKKHRVWGTPLDGIYEIYVPFKKSFCAWAVIEDIAANLENYNNIGFNLRFNVDLEDPNIITRVNSIAFNNAQIIPIDVSNGPVNVTLSLNMPVSQEEVDQKTSVFLKLNLHPLLNNPLISGTYVSAGEYKFSFTVPAKLYPGYLDYSIFINEQHEIKSTVLEGYFGESARLVITNTQNVDMLFPIVTLAEPVSIPYRPASQEVVLLGGSQPVAWNIAISDPSGVKKAIIRVSGEYDIQGQTFVLDGEGKTLFETMIQYQLDYPTCRNQRYFISYVYTEDMLGNKGESYRSSNTGIHPFYLYDDDNLDSITETTCDTTDDLLPPSISSFTLVPTSTPLYRHVQINFTVSDVESWISLDHIPVCYFTAKQNEFISSVAVITKDNSDLDRSVEYGCTFQLGAQFAPMAYLSIYGISDKAFNIRGYSSEDLTALSYTSSVAVSTPQNLHIESASSLEVSTKVLYLNGMFFLNAECVVEIQMDTEKILVTPNITSGILLVLYDLKPSYRYTISVLQMSQASNKVTVKGPLSNPVTAEPTSPPPTTPPPTTAPPTTTAPLRCNSDCGTPQGHGTCTNGACICNPPHSGLDCKSTIDTTPVIKPNPNVPSVNVSIPGASNSATAPQFTSFVSVVSLRELDNNNNPINNYEFNSERWEYITPSSSKTDIVETIQYKYKITNQLNTTITSTVQVFSQASNITFGNQQLYMNPSTIKFTFNITSFPFTRSTNSLQLVMTAGLESSEKVACSYKEFVDDSSNSQYLKIQIQDRSLFGRFIKFGIIDGRETLVSNSKLDSYYGGQSLSKSTSDQSFIGLNIPYYTQHAIIDPDFSVLIDSVSARDQANSICTPNDKKKLTTAQIAGIVVGGAVLLVIVGAVSIYFLGKKGNSRLAVKLRKIGTR